MSLSAVSCSWDVTISGTSTRAAEININMSSLSHETLPEAFDCMHHIQVCACLSWKVTAIMSIVRRADLA